MEITKQQLSAMLPGNPYLEHWCEALNKILPDYDITTPSRIAAFIAQTAHESGGYTALHENLNYRAESLCRVWPRYFNSGNANDYAHQPEKIANKAYANRMGNGSEESGDGWKYCGRGLIQLTGKSNYQAFADSIETDLSEIPAFLQTFEGAIQSACWFWENNNLNKWADAGNIEKMTQIINGGQLGIDDRKARYTHALQILGA
jgi:putative chitinase